MNKEEVKTKPKKPQKTMISAAPKERVDYVCVLDADGTKLMPTKRLGKVKYMLRDGRAKVVCRHPFTIQLTYNTPKRTQKLILGIDPGRENIGTAVVNEKGEVVYAAKVTTRNKDVARLVKERAEHRHASRRGERLHKKRRAKANGTTTDFPDGRLLHCCENPIPVKDIINSESRFNNRKRPNGWLTPTAKHLVDTHKAVVSHISKFFPITDVAVEHNKFAFMKMENGSVHGVDFQNGRLKGFGNVDEYVRNRQDNRCHLCDREIEHIHHILPRSEGGSDNADNLVGLCMDCHEAVHTGKKKININGFRKKYATASVLNQALLHIISELVYMFGEEHVRFCMGYETKNLRDDMELLKDHHIDAIVIASVCYDLPLKKESPVLTHPRLMKQFREHDRQIVRSQRERKYEMIGEDGKLVTIAKNRKPRFGQPVNSSALSDWYAKMVEKHGRHEANRMRSRLSVSKSVRYENDVKRDLPGTLFRFGGNVYVLQGRFSNGKYLRAMGQGARNHPLAKSAVLPIRRTLMYV